MILYHQRKTNLTIAILVLRLILERSTDVLLKILDQVANNEAVAILNSSGSNHISLKTTDAVSSDRKVLVGIRGSRTTSVNMGSTVDLELRSPVTEIFGDVSKLQRGGQEYFGHRRRLGTTALTQASLNASKPPSSFKKMGCKYH